MTLVGGSSEAARKESQGCLKAEKDANAQLPMENLRLEGGFKAYSANETARPKERSG